MRPDSLASASILFRQAMSRCQCARQNVAGRRLVPLRDGASQYVHDRISNTNHGDLAKTVCRLKPRQLLKSGGRPLSSFGSNGQERAFRWGMRGAPRCR